MAPFKRRTFTLLLLSPVIAALFFCPRLFPSDARENGLQQRRPTRRAAAGRKQRRAPAVASTRTRSGERAATSRASFSHASRTHREMRCDACHRAPTANWRRASGHPDVADYPDHDSCLRCHRQQFFRGARPSICSICHTVVSPRNEARFAFRKPGGATQFSVEFPHDKHQDVIARSRRPPRSAPVARRADFVSAFFAVTSHTQGDRARRYNNCTICHSTQERPLPTPRGGWPDSFVPAAEAFKTTPTGHASCFNCHWKSESPTAGDCAGCHKLSSMRVAAAADVPRRISARFTHAREQHVAECTTCHINITRASTTRGLTADVPITACRDCHNKQGTRQDVSTELEKLDRNRAFVCSYCHTSDTGRLDAPASHYLLAEREPLSRRNIK